MWLNRPLCDVLEDMRRCVDTLNFAPMKSLIEEVQIMGNRMEAGLEDKKDLIRLNEEWHELRKVVKELKAQKEALQKELGIVEKEEE